MTTSAEYVLLLCVWILGGYWDNTNLSKCKYYNPDVKALQYINYLTCITVDTNWTLLL